MQMKSNDRRMPKRKTKKRNKNKSIKTTRQSVMFSPQQSEILSKDVAKLKTLDMFEPWIKRDELDVRNFFE